MYINKIEVQMRLKQLGKTQTELAKAIGVNEKSLSKMLHVGRTKDKIAIAIAKYLDVGLSVIARLDLEDSELRQLMSIQEDLKGLEVQYKKLLDEHNTLKKYVKLLEYKVEVLEDTNKGKYS